MEKKTKMIAFCLNASNPIEAQIEQQLNEFASSYAAGRPSTAIKLILKDYFKIKNGYENI